MVIQLLSDTLFTPLYSTRGSTIDDLDSSLNEGSVNWISCDEVLSCIEIELELLSGSFLVAYFSKVVVLVRQFLVWMMIKSLGDQKGT